MKCLEPPTVLQVSARFAAEDIGEPECFKDTPTAILVILRVASVFREATIRTGSGGARVRPPSRLDSHSQHLESVEIEFGF
jgi:hypothetical protein